jgi:hypothetical protein
MILKFYRRDGDETVEAYRRAYESAPQCFRRHLVAVHGGGVPLGTWRCIFQEVAGGDLHTVLPLTDLLNMRDADFAGDCRDIVNSIVWHWNPDVREDSRSQTTRSFLGAILGERMASGGPIRRWAATARIPVIGMPTMLRRPGWRHALPNPFTLLNDSPRGSIHLVAVQVGRAHGDLNGRNVLVPVRPVRPASYVLIDYGRYTGTAPLARDPMHLLVALAMDLLAKRDLQPAERRDMISAIVYPNSPGICADTKAFQQISSAIHRGAAGAPTGRIQSHSWRQQCFLSLVAAALMHVGRQLHTRNPDADKDWCFDLACVAAAAFLAQRQMSRSGNSVNRSGDRLPPDRPRVPAVPQQKSALRLVPSRDHPPAPGAPAGEDGA